MSNVPVIFVPSNPNSLRCKLGFHKYATLVYYHFVIGGIDHDETFALRWCGRCDNLTRPKKNDYTFLINIQQVSPDDWKKAMDARRE
jgi:hypothetical protein